MQKHSITEHFTEIAKEVASRLDAHEFIFDGTYEDQDDDFEVTQVKRRGPLLEVTGQRVDGGKVTFTLVVTNVEIEGGTK